MLKKFFPILLACFVLGGCYNSGGQLRLFNRYSFFGSSPSSITVEKGDTLYSISRRYGIPLKDLIEANNLKAPYILKVGGRLSIPSARYHVVEKGDTLYSISRKYNVDVTTLSQKNHLRPPYTLNVGQRLALSGTIFGSGYVASSAQAKNTSSSVNSKKTSSYASSYTPPKKRTAKFQWPVQGRVVSTFGVIGKGRKNDGINISAARGTAVKAADKGTVAYAGNELKGFGNLILVKHPDGWITAYAHNEKLLVRKGQKVIKGEKIATVGSTGGVNSPQLHFEVRAGKKAVNPRAYLP